jgi:hypothetical protein
MTQCIYLNIPEDDDAHVVFLPMPSEGAPDESWTAKYEELEHYFISQIIKLTESRVHTTLPRKFSDGVPANVKITIDELIQEWYGGDEDSHIQIKITNPQTMSSTHFASKWFDATIINHLRRTLRREQQSGEHHSPLEGYEICFTSTNYDIPALIVVEHVLTSDEYDSADDGTVVFKGEHLTPLQNQLDESIKAATTVIRSLNLMERREKRMRKTADSINWRVRNFTYFSVLVLILVTFFQVTYLKRYFKKKKLM